MCRAAGVLLAGIPAGPRAPASGHPPHTTCPFPEVKQASAPRGARLTPISAGGAVDITCAELVHVWCDGTWISSRPIRLYRLPEDAAAPAVGISTRCWCEAAADSPCSIAVAGTRSVRLTARFEGGEPRRRWLPQGTIRLGMPGVAEWIPGQPADAAIGVPLAPPQPSVLGISHAWRQLPPLCARIEAPAGTVEQCLFGPPRPSPATVRFRLALHDFALGIEVGERAGLPDADGEGLGPPIWLTYHDRFLAVPGPTLAAGWRCRRDIALRPSSEVWPAAARRFWIEGLGPAGPPLLDTEVVRRPQEVVIPCRHGALSFRLGSLLRPGAWKMPWLGPSADQPELTCSIQETRIIIRREQQEWLSAADLAATDSRAAAWVDLAGDRIPLARSFLGGEWRCRIGPVSATARPGLGDPIEIQVDPRLGACRVWLVETAPCGIPSARRGLFAGSHRIAARGPEQGPAGISELWVEWRPATPQPGAVCPAGPRPAASRSADGSRAPPPGKLR